MTTTLVASCAVIFGLQILIPIVHVASFWLQGRRGRGRRVVPAGHRPAFLHGSLMHILFNMYALWVVGRPLEALLGRTRFADPVPVSPVRREHCVVPVEQPRYTSRSGASGAIFGLFGGMLVVARRMRWNLVAA